MSEKELELVIRRGLIPFVVGSLALVALLGVAGLFVRLPLVCGLSLLLVAAAWVLGRMLLGLAGKD